MKIKILSLKSVLQSKTKIREKNVINCMWGNSLQPDIFLKFGNVKSCFFNKHKIMYIAISKKRKKIRIYICTSRCSLINVRQSNKNLKGKL